MPLILTKYPGGKTNKLKLLYEAFRWANCDKLIDGCAGMGSVSLNLPEKMFSKVTANDLDSYVNNVWNHFYDDALFAELKGLLLKTMYNIDVYWKARRIYCEGYLHHSVLDIAWATIVSHRFSKQSMPCNMFNEAGRNRGGLNEYVNAWISYLETLDFLHEEVKKIEITKEDISDIVYTETDRKTLIYCDVTYPKDTRYCKMFRTEMTDKKHEHFLKRCRDSKCKIIITGRPNNIYEYMLHDWHSYVHTPSKFSGRTVRAKTPELIWSNFEWIN